MDNRRGIGRFGVRGILTIAVPAAGLALALVGVVPAGDVLAQQNAGGTISIGGSIADTVTGAVSGIATSSGGVQTSHSELEFGDQEGLAISDASGGNRNASLNSK